MRQHRFTGHVADGPDIAHAGLAALVDSDGGAVHLQLERFQVETLRTRAATYSHQHPVGFQAQLLALAVTGQQATVVVTFDAMAQVHGNT
ncbi:hypothetical protein D3C81_1609100 [compost metagenome]